MVVLDTNILIDHLRRPEGTSILSQILQKYPQDELAISVITIQELYEGQSTKRKEKKEDLLSTLSPLRILGYSQEVAQIAGQLCRDVPRTHDFPDAAIAATCLVNHCQLATLDVKDFAGIPELRMVNLKIRDAS